MAFPQIRTAYVHKDEGHFISAGLFHLIHLTNIKTGRDPGDTASSLHHALA